MRKIAKSSRATVVITTYNRSRILETTLNSVLAQTYNNLEIIVVDDGSTDDTAEMMKKYSDRVIYIRQQNLGVEAARKKGVEISTGDYINFLDDDDLMTKDKIERQVKVLDSKPDIGVVHCGYYFIDEDDNYMDRTGWLPSGDVRLSLVWGCFPWSGGPLIRKECFKYIGENEHKDWHSDWGMWLRFAIAGGYKWDCIQEPLGYYRMVRGSMTDDKVANVERLILNILGHVYTSYELTPDILAEKNQIYGSWYFWVSCRYYAGGHWEDGKRTLLEVVRWNKELIEKPDKLIELFHTEAVTPRVRIHDPLAFINKIFDHLPQELEFINEFRDDLLDRISASLIMKCYGLKNTNEPENYINRLIINRSVNKITYNLIFTEFQNLIVNPFLLNPFSLFKKIHKRLDPLNDELSDNLNKAVHYLASANVFYTLENYLNKNWKLLLKRILLGLTNYPFVHSKVTLALFVKKFLRLIGKGKPAGNQTPLVSVVIPTYNKSRFLKQAIDSVLNQTYPNIEIIVVDDGSTDDTEQTALSYGNRIKYIKQTNMGGTAARNTGIKYASGIYLNFLDHDDIFLPEKIEKQVHYLETNPSAGMVHCRYYFIDANGRRLAKVFVLSVRNILKKLLLGCYIWSGGPLVRKTCLDKVGLFDGNVWSSDWDMWLRIAQSGYKIGCIQQPLGEYRIHPDSTMNDVHRTELEDIRILDKVFRNPALPGKIKNIKNEVYARWRLWLSCRYYATGTGKSGGQNLGEAIELFPDLLKYKEGFHRRISDEAVDFRVDNPLSFASEVFNNLPDNVILHSENKLDILSSIYLRLALRDYGYGDIIKAKTNLSKAVYFNPSLLKKPDEFLWVVFVYSMRLPVEPNDYVNFVFNNLPKKADDLKRLKNKIIAHINIARAYENYSTGNSILRYIFKGMKNKPSLGILFKTWMYYA